MMVQWMSDKDISDMWEEDYHRERRRQWGAVLFLLGAVVVYLGQWIVGAT